MGKNERPTTRTYHMTVRPRSIHVANYLPSSFVGTIHRRDHLTCIEVVP